MPRPNRYAQPGHMYHVISRFPGHFLSEQDLIDGREHKTKLCDHSCGIFEAALRKNKKKFGFGLICCVLMSTHYHLIIAIPPTDQEGTISRILHGLHSDFAHWYNRFKGRIGQVIVDRPSTPVVEDSAHLLNAIRYIHRNPTASSLEVEPEDWKYSTHRAHATRGKEGWLADLIDYDPSKFGILGFEHLTANKLFKILKKSCRKAVKNLGLWWRKVRCAQVIGSTGFRAQIRQEMGLSQIKMGPWVLVPGN